MSEQDDRCAVCWERLTDATPVIGPCGHLLHEACAEPLSRCPLCRSPCFTEEVRYRVTPPTAAAAPEAAADNVAKARLARAWMEECKRVGQLARNQLFAGIGARWRVALRGLDYRNRDFISPWLSQTRVETRQLHLAMLRGSELGERSKTQLPRKVREAAQHAATNLNAYLDSLTALASALDLYLVSAGEYVDALDVAVRHGDVVNCAKAATWMVESTTALSLTIQAVRDQATKASKGIALYVRYCAAMGKRAADHMWYWDKASTVAAIFKGLSVVGGCGLLYFGSPLLAVSCLVPLLVAHGAGHICGAASARAAAVVDDASERKSHLERIDMDYLRDHIAAPLGRLACELDSARNTATAAVAAATAAACEDVKEARSAASVKTRAAVTIGLERTQLQQEELIRGMNLRGNQRAAVNAALDALVEACLLSDTDDDTGVHADAAEVGAESD